jgi:hypothetical protein
VSTVNRFEPSYEFSRHTESLNLYPYNIGQDQIEPEPMNSEPMEQEQIEPEPMDPEPMEQEHIEPEPMDLEPMEPETIEPEPMDSEPMEQEQINQGQENMVPTNNNNNVEEDSEPPPLMDLSGNIVYPLSLNDNSIRYEEISEIDADEVIFYENNNTLFVNNNQPEVVDNSCLQFILNNSILVNPISLYPKSDDENCSICYEKYENHNIVKTNCNHSFCYTCVTKFTKDKKQCPMCRAYILNLNIHFSNLLPTNV